MILVYLDVAEWSNVLRKTQCRCNAAAGATPQGSSRSRAEAAWIDAYSRWLEVYAAAWKSLMYYHTGWSKISREPLPVALVVTNAQS